jgi:hypothetical protein
MFKIKLWKATAVAALSSYFCLFTLLGYAYAGNPCCTTQNVCSTFTCTGTCQGSTTCDTSSYYTCNNVNPGCPGTCVNSGPGWKCTQDQWGGPACGGTLTPCSCTVTTPSCG